MQRTTNTAPVQAAWAWSFFNKLFTTKEKQIMACTSYIDPPPVRKVIGYELKPDFRVNLVREAIAGLCGVRPDANDKIMMGPDFTPIKALDKLGALKLWFNPILEERQEISIMVLNCDPNHNNGRDTFELQVSAKGIYFRSDSAWLNVYDLRKAISEVSVRCRKPDCRGIYGMIDSFYRFKPTYIDSGCKKGVPVYQWEKVLAEYDKLSGKIGKTEQQPRETIIVDLEAAERMAQSGWYARGGIVDELRNIRPEMPRSGSPYDHPIAD